MGLTSAQRQARSRIRNILDPDATCANLQMVIDKSAKLAVARMARHFGCTQRKMMETMLSSAEDDVVRTMDDEQRKQYYAVPSALNFDDNV